MSDYNYYDLPTILIIVIRIYRLWIAPIGNHKERKTLTLEYVGFWDETGAAAVQRVSVNSAVDQAVS